MLVGKMNSIFSAARLMRDHEVNELIVVESRHGVNIPIGLLSGHDIVVNIIAEERGLDRLVVGDIFKDSLLTANEDNEIAVTLKRMRHEGARRIVIINKSRALIGILSIEHILDKLAEQLNDIDQIITRNDRRDMRQIVFKDHY